MSHIALVQGASRGLGLALVRALESRGAHVVATCREPESSELATLGVETLALDVTDEDSIAGAAAEVEARHGRLDLLVNVAGLLHQGEQGPEKRLADIDPRWLMKSFEVNAFGPVLVAKHFHRLLTAHRERAVMVNVSARVGSIEDDRLGGWYAYRASKAAQNMFTRNIAIELGRASKEVIVLAYHPGTVATDLSAPFQRRVPEGQLHTAAAGAAHLLDLADAATRETHHGRFFAWDGAPIPW